jgi:hypothetical protein
MLSRWQTGQLGGTMHLHFMRLAVLLLAVTPTSNAAQQRVPPAIFTDLGLTTEQVATIDAGRPVAKVLPGAIRPRCMCSARYM